MAVRISAARGRQNLIKLPRSHWQGIRLVTTAHKTTAKPLAHIKLSFLFNQCARHTQSLKCCMPTKQQTTAHTYQLWKLTEVPGELLFQGNACTACAPWGGHFHSRAPTQQQQLICLGCLNTWEPNQCCSSSQGTTYPESLDKWPKCSKTANDTKAEELADRPTREAECSAS